MVYDQLDVVIEGRSTALSTALWGKHLGSRPGAHIGSHSSGMCILPSCEAVSVSLSLLGVFHNEDIAQ